MSGRETRSFWQAERELKLFPPLSHNQEADICIIGAGISGLTAAYLLSKEGKSVVVLDDGPIGGGQTVRTTGHLTNTLDDRYYHLENYFGEKNTKRIAESHRAAIDLIESLVKKHQIECEFEHVKAYLFVPPNESTDVLKKELKAARNAGLKDVGFVDRSPIHSFDTGLSLCFPHQAQFSPLPYLEKLCECIKEQGGKIYCKTHAEQVVAQKPGYRVSTDQKHSVSAKHVIYAANAFTGSRLLPHTKQAPYRTYVIAGEIPRGSVVKAIYYDTLDPYHYIRICHLDAHKDLLIVGGEDHRTAEKRDIRSIYEKLKKWTFIRFPMLKEIKYHWSGQVIEPVDSIAFIGRLKKNEEEYLITGDSGNGLTHGTLGAILICDLIMGRANPWEEIYDPHRITFKTAGEFVQENCNTFWQYRDWFKKGEVKSEKEIKNNCGAVVCEGLKKMACYRDSEGKVHKVSAKCPHLGALVRWNESEHCWECPAHGSRFDTNGQVLQGPSNGNLQKD